MDDAVSLSIDILSLLSDCKDLWTYSEWVLLESPRFAMSLLTHSRRSQPSSPLFLPFDKVLAFLREDLMENEENENGFDFIEYYLEFVVRKCSDSSGSPSPSPSWSMSQYHDDLAYLYMKKIRRGVCEEETRQKLLELLESSQLISPSKLLEHAKKFQLYDEIIELNKKLLRHNDVLYTLVIDKKDHEEAVRYCMETAPSSKDRSDRFLQLLRLYFEPMAKDEEERLSVLREEEQDDDGDGDEEQELMEPQHTKKQTVNLELLRQEMMNENDEFAFMDCMDLEEEQEEHPVHTRQRSGIMDIASTATTTRRHRGAISVGSKLESRFESGMDRELFLDKGCEILYEYAFDMDYLRVLELLPSSMDVTFLEKYVRKIIPYIVHKRRMKQITKNLHKRQYLRQRTELAKLRSQFVKMDHSSLCAKCRKRIGGSVFILQPRTQSKFHYSCFYKKREPMTHDFQSPVLSHSQLDPFGVNNPFNDASNHSTNPFGRI